MSKYRNKPKPTHLEMIEKMGAPACVTGRGPTTEDLGKVTCRRCIGSGTYSRRKLREMAKVSGR